MAGMYIVLLKQTLRILHQIINSATKRLLNETVTSQLLILIKINYISIDRNDSTIARCVLSLFDIFHVSVLKSIIFKND